jgi:hypothetical protein
MEQPMSTVAREAEVGNGVSEEQLDEPESRGNFFAVDRQNWNRSCDGGMNMAVAHLVLARGTGPNQQTTSWSTNAIEERTGISRHRARAAIGDLALMGIIGEIGGTPTKPKYKLSIPAVPDWITLPNSLVGEPDEVSPIELIRNTRCIRTLRLFVDLYALQYLPVEGGVDRRQVRIEYSKNHVAQLGRHVVYGFVPGDLRIPNRASFMAVHLPDIPTDEEVSIIRNDMARSFELLQHLNLLEFVCHLVEGDDDDAEILYPLPLPGTGTAAEQELSDAANAAAFSILNRAGINPAEVADYKLLVPLQMQHLAAEAVGVARLVHRPKTAMTVEWHRRSSRWNAITREFQKLR